MHRVRSISADAQPDVPGVVCDDLGADTTTRIRYSPSESTGQKGWVETGPTGFASALLRISAPSCSVYRSLCVVVVDALRSRPECDSLIILQRST